MNTIRISIYIDSTTRTMNTIRISIYIDGTTRTSTQTQHQPEQRLIKVSLSINKEILLSSVNTTSGQSDVKLWHTASFRIYALIFMVPTNLLK